jgi:hypothetical protein
VRGNGGGRKKERRPHGKVRKGRQERKRGGREQEKGKEGARGEREKREDEKAEGTIIHSVS